MTGPRPPAWLAGFQANFGEMLRTPLTLREGHLRDDSGQYPEALVAITEAGVRCGARQRLAVYNRQYWFRLFGVLQRDFRLTCALLGPFALNRLATQYLLVHPPTHADLGRAGDAFADFLAERFPLERKPRAGAPPALALTQATRIDAAFREVFAAPEVPAFQPSASAAARLPTARLRPSPAARLVQEAWPLVELRRSVVRSPLAERPVSLPPRHAGGERAWAVVRHRGFPRAEPLEKGQAALYAALRELPLEDALGRLQHETALPQDELAAATQRWMREGLRLGLWSGLDEPAP